MRTQVIAIVPQPLDRRRHFGGACFRRDPQILDDTVQSLRMAMDPGGEPAADVASAGDGRKVVELVQKLQARERLQDAESEGRAAYASAGEAESRAFRVAGVDVPEERGRAHRIGGPHRMILGQGAVQQFGFFLQNRCECQRVVRRSGSSHRDSKGNMVRVALSRRKAPVSAPVIPRLEKANHMPSKDGRTERGPATLSMRSVPSADTEIDANA